MKTVVIVQARMTSTRLPGKVLANLAGRPLLTQQLRRLRECLAVNEIVIATTTNHTDDPIADLAMRENVSLFRGSEQDVLSRFVGAANLARADVVVRITADCPLIDPAVTDRVVRDLTEHVGECDYASNTEKRTFPRGLDTEAFFIDTLLRIDRLGSSTAAREHVTVFLRSEKPHLFLIRDVIDAEDNSDLRLTVDTEADLQLIRIIYDELNLANRTAPFSEIVGFLRENPRLASINKSIETWSPTHNRS